jgi:hypothetical protein
MVILGRCLQVEVELQCWDVDADEISARVAADALDQAVGLLEELQAGRAGELVAAVRRIAATLPPPLE